ncbi:MAG: hypothetical protein ABIA21_00605 [Candidatus Aenigmatarchaeota archaeon]
MNSKQKSDSIKGVIFGLGFPIDWPAKGYSITEELEKNGYTIEKLDGNKDTGSVYHALATKDGKSVMLVYAARVGRDPETKTSWHIEDDFYNKEHIGNQTYKREWIEKELRDYFWDTDIPNAIGIGVAGARNGIECGNDVMIPTEASYFPHVPKTDDENPNFEGEIKSKGDEILVSKLSSKLKQYGNVVHTGMSQSQTQFRLTKYAQNFGKKLSEIENYMSADMETAVLYCMPEQKMEKRLLHCLLLAILPVIRVWNL